MAKNAHRFKKHISPLLIQLRNEASGFSLSTLRTRMAYRAQTTLRTKSPLLRTFAFALPTGVQIPDVESRV